MSSKRIVFLAFSVLFLSSTPTTKPMQVQVDDNTQYLGTIATGVIISAGGTYLMTKNPKKKEGIIGRAVRTVFGAGMIVAGLGLTLENKIVVKHIKDHGYIHFLHHVASLVRLGGVTGYIFNILPPAANIKLAVPA